MTLDWKDVAAYLGWGLTGLLSLVGARVWKDLEHVKTQSITRTEFQKALAAVDKEFSNKHTENTGNFRRLEDKVGAADDSRHAEAIGIERRLGELALRIAEIRLPQPRQEGPERRAGY